MKEEILVRFDLLVAKVSEISPDIWTIYIKQQYAKGFLAIVSFAIFISLLLCCIKNGYKYWTDEKAKEEKKVFWAVSSVIIGLICFLCFLELLMGSCFLRVINPEYYAIKDLINILK